MDESPQPDAPVSPLEVPLLLFLRGAVMLVLVLGVALGLHHYLGVRLIRDGGVAQPLAGALWVALYALFASIPVGFIGGRTLPKPFSTAVFWVGFLWMGCFAVLLPATLFSDLVRLAAGALWALPPEAGRWQALAVASVSGAALAWGFFVARATPTLERVTVKVPRLGPGLDGLRIVQVSDIHIGETLGQDFLERLVAQVNALAPDVIAVTGDLVDGSVAKLSPLMGALGQLKAPHGVYFVTGNHEYYSGGASWEAEVARRGLTVLHNAHRVVERGGAKLVIAGVTDLEGARFSPAHAPDLDAALHGAPAGAPRILLAHQPRFARHAQGKDIALQLSGHTHGGQIFPFMAFVKLQQPVVAGFKVLWGVPTYTNRGTGYWGPPFRVGPSGEVTEVTLRSA